MRGSEASLGLEEGCSHPVLVFLGTSSLCRAPQGLGCCLSVGCEHLRAGTGVTTGGSLLSLLSCCCACSAAAAHAWVSYCWPSGGDKENTSAEAGP